MNAFLELGSNRGLLISEFHIPEMIRILTGGVYVEHTGYGMIKTWKRVESDDRLTLQFVNLTNEELEKLIGKRPGITGCNNPLSVSTIPNPGAVVDAEIPAIEDPTIT